MPVVLGRVGSDQSCRGVVSAGRIGSGRVGPVLSESRECRSCWVGPVLSGSRVGSGWVGPVLSESRIGSGRVGPVLSESRECRSYWVGSYWVGSGRTSPVGES